MSVAESALPGIEAGRVERWLAEHVDGLAGPVEFGLVSGGRSNLTYRLTDAAGVNYALRRPPTGGVLSTAHDVSREWRFISALAPTAVPVPPPVAYCADSTVTGAEFYVMGFVEGLVLADRAAGLALARQARASAAEHVVDVLVALHALDPVVVGLGDMVRKTGYIERQLRRWHAQVHATGAPELALLDEVHDLLARRVPAQSGGIVHGDYRAGNMAFGPDGGVRAVFDWELATTGDPMADLGWLASTWQDPGEQLPPTTPGPSTVAGFPARAQLVRRYARLSGRDVSNLPYWVAFSRWRSACIGVGVRARYLAGHMADDGFAAGLLTSAEPGAAGSRVVLAEAARDALRAAGLLLPLSRQLTRSEGMAWDFSTDPRFQRKLDWVERFCREKVEPLDYVFPHAVRWPDPVVKAYVRELQQEVKDQGLWAIFLDRELGGPGFGQLRLALLNEVIGRYAGAPSMFGASAPDTGNMEILAAYGTEEQKKRWLEPLLNQDMFSAFSMTEPQGGSDPNLFKTHAVQDGDEWVINGEKWFTSAGRIADLLFVMCTNGMFVVPRATSTLEARTDIAAVKFTMAKVLREVSYNALHILGSLGTTDLTPIQAMYASAPAMGIADGVDEVHKATVARRVLCPPVRQQV